MTFDKYILELLYSRISQKKIIRVFSNLDLEEINKGLNYACDTSLIIACKQNLVQVVKYLVDRFGADIVNYRNTSCYQDSALSWAVFLGHEEITKILVQKGADVSIRTQITGKSLLAWAHFSGHYGIFKYLLFNGCDLSLLNFNGESIRETVKNSEAYSQLIDRWVLTMKKLLHKKFYDQFNVYERALVQYILSFYVAKR